MDGILVGCDSAQEWLLPWWYKHLREYNPAIPIAFGDLGLSETALDWCKKRGTVVATSQIPISENEWLFEGKKWVSDPPPSSQFAWFRKPFLMQRSPFKRTLWLDLDCEVLGDLSPLFALSLLSTKFAVAVNSNYFKMFTEDKQHCLEIKRVNSGVILFEKGSQLLDFWADFTQRAYRSFRGDGCVLAFAISNYHFPVAEIPCKYNWLTMWGRNPEAVILHWVGEKAKSILKLEIDAESAFSYRKFPLFAIEQEFRRR